MSTIKEMADLIGVSPTTVSNVIHGKTKQVSKETIEKIEKILREHHYVPNMSARNLAQNSSKIIGVIVQYGTVEDLSAIQSPFHGEIVGAIEAAIRKMGYYMMLYCPEDIDEIMKFVTTWNVDGLIVMGLGPAECQKVKRSTQRPVVFIDCYFCQDDIDYVNVGLEDEHGIYEIVRYLIEKGHKKIGFCSTHDQGVDGERWKGYLHAMEEAEIPVSKETDFYLQRLDPKMMGEDLEKIFEARSKVTAFLFTTDYLAVNAIRFFKERGLNIPQDISVVGFDDNILGKTVSPGLTTVRQDPTLKGRLAVEQLVKLIDGTPLDQSKIFLPAQLVIRETVKTI